MEMGVRNENMNYRDGVSEAAEIRQKSESVWGVRIMRVRMGTHP